MPPKHPLVLVHGAWHGAWCWSATQAELDRAAIASWAIDLPGHGVSQEGLGDLHTDAATLRDVVTRVSTGGDRSVVLVGHSYGGAVITQAAAWLEAAGVKVAHLVYVAAFAVADGESVWSLAGSLPDPTVPAMADALVARDDGTVVISSPQAATAAFYGCCDAPVAAAAYERLSPQAASSLRQPVNGDPRLTIASSYVICSQDQALPVRHQQFLAERCETRYGLETDHSPFLSTPGALAEILADIALM